MGKLHELLAVESELKGEAQRALRRVQSTFDGNKLLGEIRTYQPMEEGGEVFDDQVTVLATNVADELAMFQAAFGAWIDAAVQKETTNQQTGASIVVGESIQYDSLPAPALLNLESKLAEIRKVYAAIPTNDPRQQWEWDQDQGCYVSRPQTTYRTKKKPKSFVAYEATKEHPAQVEMFTEDMRVGTWTTTVQSGAISPSKKRKLLARIDALARAVKQARQRANDTDTIDIRVAQWLFEYIHRE